MNKVQNTSRKMGMDLELDVWRRWRRTLERVSVKIETRNHVIWIITCRYD